MACSTVRAMTYRLQQKATPLGGAAPQFGAPSEGAPTPEEEVEQHEWAGDLYDVGDETLPEEAFARLAGEGGAEEAWLDKAEDGTLTGWVRDTDGSVYRYSDADAWAVDVDQAQMVRDADPAVEEEPLDGEEEFVEEAPGTNEGGVDPNAPVEELAEEEPEYDADGNLVETVVEDEFEEELVDEDDPEEDLDADLEEEDEEEDEEDEDDKKGAFLRKMQGKSLPGPGGLRYLVRPVR